jgi:hypothetical protein
MQCTVHVSHVDTRHASGVLLLLLLLLLQKLTDSTSPVTSAASQAGPLTNAAHSVVEVGESISAVADTCQ